MARYIAIPFIGGGAVLPIPTPTMTAVPATGSQINLAIQYAGPPGAVSYSFEKATAALGPYSPLASGTSNTFQDTGLLAATTYFYRARVQVIDGRFSSFSPSVSATTLASAPGIPQNLAGSATGPNTDTLTWNQVAQATGYNMYRGGIIIASPPASPFNDSGLTPSTTYQYNVTATNPSGESLQSNSVFITTTVQGGTGLIKWNPGPYGAQMINSLGQNNSISGNGLSPDITNLGNSPGIIGYRLLTTWGFWEGGPTNAQGSYTDAFSKIDALLAQFAAMNPPRHLYVTLMPNKDNGGAATVPPTNGFYIPRYILNNPGVYGAGLGLKNSTGQTIADPNGNGGYYMQASGGYGANICNTNVLNRLIALMQAIANKYDDPRVGNNALFEGIQIVEDSNWFPAINTGLSTGQFKPALKSFLSASVAAFQHTNIGMQATYMNVAADSYEFEQWMVNNRIAPATADSFGQTLFNNPTLLDSKLQWGQKALLGLTTFQNNTTSTGPDLRPLCRPQMDVQSTELCVPSFFASAGGGWTAQDVALAMRDNYKASHYFFSMAYRGSQTLDANGTFLYAGEHFLAANDWFTAVPVLTSIPTITSYPPNYP